MNKNLLVFFISIFFTPLIGCFNASINWSGSSKQNVSLTGASCPTQLTGNVVPLYPVTGANWNDYVHITPGVPWYAQFPETACIGTETSTNYYTACVHGGEHRKVVLPGISSCSGLAGTDALNAFDWFCDASSGTATFFSFGLRAGMGLRNLVDPAGTGFRSNSFGVTQNGCPILTTPSTLWWNNPVVVAPANSGAGAGVAQLASAGTVYVIPNTTGMTPNSSGYNIEADKISLVTAPGVTLQNSGVTTKYCSAAGGYNPGGANAGLICSNATKFVWIEMQINNSNPSGQIGVLAGAINQWRIHLTQVTNSFTVGISLNSMTNSLIDSTRVANSGSDGIDLNLSTGNVLNGVKVANNAGFGILLDGFATSLVNIFSQNNAVDGVHLFTSSVAQQDNVVVGLTSSQNLGSGLSFSIGTPALTRTTVLNLSSFLNGAQGFFLNSVPSTTAANILLAGNSADGMYVVSNSNSFADIFSTNQGGHGINLGSGTANNNFSGRLSVGSNSLTDCSNSGAGSNQLNNSCSYGPSFISTAVSGVNLNSSFSNSIVTVNDPMNGTSQAGALAFYTNVSDWLNFSSNYRGWGPSGSSSIFDSSRRSKCSSGSNCQIYDSRPTNFDNVVKNINGVFQANQPCPPSIDASVAANVVTDATGRTFLKNAVEWVASGTGNGNGLCESGETCLFSPNAGAYQGESTANATFSKCTFNGGNGVTNVTILGYLANGI